MQNQQNEDHTNGISKQKNTITGVLIWTVLAVAVGSGFQHGYNTGVLNAPQKVMETWINQTTPMTENELTIVWSTATSIMCIGGIIGGALTGVLSTKLGRRLALIINNGIAIVAGLTMGSSKYVGQPWMIILGRFIIGINAGLNTGIGPMYLSEISPTRLRGSITAVYSLSMTIFILLSQIVGTDMVLGTEQLWPYILYLVLIPAVYQILALIWSPESPKYLLEINNDKKAIKASTKLNGREEGMKNIEQIREELEAAKAQPSVVLKDMWVFKKYRKPLIIMCVLMAAQQLSGVNAIIYYSTQIFKTANLSEELAQWATIGVGVVNVLTSVVAVFLVDVLGRKPLLIIGYGGITIDLTLFLICLYFVEKSMILAYGAISLVYLFMILFAIGPGPIPWLMGSELFETSSRPLGLSIAVPINWVSNFFVGQVFLPLQEDMGPSVFIIFIVCTALATLFIIMNVPETKNRSINEIAASFK
ncbi:hypothetical protein GE061_018060 [Apolygus lucorum]|uniref:Major facilitator superfamily (MFS) profile domain-containing protein n=1 Tax=Apolygus lucorum TaxID=248454 RepID=A0A8S9XE72_APOLU|nr:hypothetical protein GE061_018060 [Apolygus lucorum]